MYTYIYACCVIVLLQCVWLVQVVLRITPLCEGELTVLGFIYHLCVDYEGTQQQQRQSSSKKGSESPGRTSQLPSLTVSSKDTLYQKQQNYKVQQSLAEGVQVYTCTYMYDIEVSTIHLCMQCICYYVIQLNVSCGSGSS